MNKKLLEEIMRDIRLDTSNLEEVWQRQPELVASYGFKLALVERAASSAKRDLDFIEAKLYRLNRADHSYGGARMSEAAIQAKVYDSDQYKEARQAYDEKKYLVDVYKQVISALSHRRDMIVQASKKAIIEYEKSGLERFHAPKNAS